MPIRFRCAYCNQLMGISRRKIGNVVRCPKCSGQVVVPNPDDGQAADDGPEDANAPAHALEDPELERLLAGGAAKPKASSPRPAPQQQKFPDMAFDVDVEPVDAPPNVPSVPATTATVPRGALLMPRWVLFSLVFLALLLAGLAFLVGYLLGKQVGA